MKRITIILSAFTAILAGLTACRGMVFEDRTVCEAQVLFDVRNGRFFNEDDAVCIGTRLYEGVDGFSFESTTVGAMRGLQYRHGMEGHGSWSGFGILGYDDLDRNGYCLVSAPGKEYAPLYVFDFKLSDVVGTVTVPVLFHKEHSCVKVVFSGWDESIGGLSPFKLRIAGGTNGIDLLNRVPVLGDYDICPREVKAGVFEFIVPRLGDGNLVMKVSLKEGAGDIPVYPREINLWSYMKVLGNFNWNLDDLPDVEFDVDITGPVYGIRFTEWEGSKV